MNFIKHTIEFKKLSLVWQSENDPNHLRYVVAELIRDGDEVQLKYLKNSQDYSTALSFGFKGYPAFTVERDIHSNGVLEAFKRRLPPRSRSDFGKYLEMYCLPQGAEISDFALLGYSGAKLPGDEFSIIPAFDDIQQSCEFLTEVAGFRHETQIPIDDIELNTKVDFEREQSNSYDNNAIKILIDGKKIGYVARSLLPQFNNWLDQGFSLNARIERRNGQPERPTLYIFVELRSENFSVRKPRV